MSKCNFFKKEIEYLGHLVSSQGISQMKQKIKTITDLAPTTNITEDRHVIGLIGYYRKLFPIFSDNIRPLNELTRKNVPFKWTAQCQRSLDYIKWVITTNPILIYSDPNKQYYPFICSRKHYWSAILVQCAEQTKDDCTKIPLQLLIKVELLRALKRSGAL